MLLNNYYKLCRFCVVAALYLLFCIPRLNYLVSGQKLLLTMCVSYSNTFFDLISYDKKRKPNLITTKYPKFS